MYSMLWITSPKLPAQSREDTMIGEGSRLRNSKSVSPLARSSRVRVKRIRAHIYISTYIHMYICTYKHTYIHTHMYICIYTYTYIHIYRRTYIHTSIHICMCIYMCIHIYTYILYIHMHAWMHDHGQSLLHMYIYIDTCTSVCIHRYMHLFTRVHIHIYLYACMQWCMDACMHICMHAKTSYHVESQDVGPHPLFSCLRGTASMGPHRLYTSCMIQAGLTKDCKSAMVEYRNCLVGRLRACFRYQTIGAADVKSKHLRFAASIVYSQGHVSDLLLGCC